MTYTYIICNTEGHCRKLISPSIVGSTYLDEHNETALTVIHWNEAHKIRTKHFGYIGIISCSPFNILLLLNIQAI